MNLRCVHRPSASSRAMLMALALPDHRDPRCPAEFEAEAHGILNGYPRADGWTTATDSDDGLRKGILPNIADFASFRSPRREFWEPWS